MRKHMIAAAIVGIALSVAHSEVRAGGIRGEAEAVAAAKRLLAQAGGAEAWRADVFEVTERIYPASGQAADVRIARDFARPARLLISVSPVRTLTEWVSPEGGWTKRNDVVTVMSPERLAIELQGLRQEPYAIYHRIARDDPGLRVEQRDQTTLHFYDDGERLLSWFQLAPNGVLLGWGNFYDGAVNQHYYGPVVVLGSARLPKFGATASGSYRFEYLSARLSQEPLQAPAQKN